VQARRIRLAATKRSNAYWRALEEARTGYVLIRHCFYVKNKQRFRDAVVLVVQPYRVPFGINGDDGVTSAGDEG